MLTITFPVLRQYVAEFIKDYAVRTNDGWRSKALRKKYLYSESDTDGVPMDKDLAKLLGVTSESVRNIKKLASAFCEDLYSRQDEAFLLLKDIKRIEVKSILMKRFGFGNDEKTLRFYLDGMGYTITEQENLGCYCVNAQYYGTGLTGILREVIPDVKEILTSNPVPVRMESVMDQLKAKGLDMLRLKFAEDYMLADSDVFEVAEKDGYTHVSMKWGALPSVSARQVSILYDFALRNGADAFMTKADLTREYNTRAYLYDDVEQIDESRAVTKNDHIEFGGNGTYRYIGNPDKKDPRVDLKAELLKYLAGHNGIAPFADLRKYVDANGWRYSDVTIRMYLTNENDCVLVWKKGEGKRAYYILSTWWPIYEQQGFYRPGKGDTGTGRPVPRPVPSYKVAIIDKAVGLLQAAPGKTMRKKDIFEAVVDLYPRPSKINVYKILAEAPAILSSGTGKSAVYTLAENIEE